MNWLWMSLYHALAMLWMTFWALVLGFGNLGRAAGFREQGTDDARIWSRRFSRGSLAHVFRRGKFFMLIRGSRGRAQRVSTRRRT